ncbi:hypothetical protein A3B42_02410 [Candidatus Daviesbacteria bacterium RIFCSPLOWO2_01_FULL_38_10]|nr:MAG: hypothetical protein A3D02_03265 [Candidatus Daviesbacteria bacterium RIFCSPHIGHO2_02_FULL_39_41]OGE39592.1 MAG: hypothetical protein A3B42_02410 [Candidatus Daviesbacteria bacterium RIFCSPLOWO2_01_FULL_38_10]OGE45451.1 MAG: hypothetical protein A3E67_00130 [Candidatus Daviesbacteria bacterium RIFCSPHIGHO2_12_FULL_38_25]OGE68763.1 MAG: hypothetical protein A3H81_06145 [Candidatus Daviesbacteria bacterium RIFCSPLOWO2_02_FULL_38_18]
MTLEHVDISVKPEGVTDLLEILREHYFLSPDGKNADYAVNLVEIAVHAVVSSQGEAPTYPIATELSSISQVIETAEVPSRIVSDPDAYLRRLPFLMQGAVRGGHPFMVKNIIPTASLPALAAYYAVSPLMANGVTGEDAAQILMAEPACASALSKLAGFDHNKSGGVFTFGGTGTNLYAIKIGLSKALPNHHMTGVREDVVVIESAPSHYSHRTATDWLGIGQNNLVKVSSNRDQTTNLEELEEKMRGVIESGRKIACIVAVGGTTSNMGIDDIKQINEMRERLGVEYKLSYNPHLHVDSVLGWAYLNFSSYDFASNPLGFRPQILQQIHKIVDRVSTYRYADSFGVDFHKTGYVAYNSSMLIVRDRKDLMRLQRDGNTMTPLFHDEQAYNPGQFTLETSRSAANMLASWIALQTFGQEGYQALLGHNLEMGSVFREGIKNNIDKGLYLANQEFGGSDVFVRCYPIGIDSREEYEIEMKDDRALQRNNEYTSRFFKWLSKNDRGFVSKTTAAIYTDTGASMVALRIYPLSPYITEQTAKQLIDGLAKAKMQFDTEDN